MFIVPLIDTITVFVRRLMRKQSPFVGGKDHTTHHLAYLGLKDGTVAIILLLISLASVGFVYFLYGKFKVWQNSYTILGFVYFIALFVTMQILYNIGKTKQQQKLLQKNKLPEDISES